MEEPRGALFSFHIQYIPYALKVRNRARVQFRLGLPKAGRRRRGAATSLPRGMHTEVEVEMAALRPGGEGLFMIICFGVPVHSAPGTDLCCEPRLVLLLQSHNATA